MDYAALKAELTAGHPETGAYNADNKLAADELNAPNRDTTSGGIDGMVTYLATHKNRTNEGGDLVGTAMLGRLWRVADADVGSDPFARAGGAAIEQAQKDAARAFGELLRIPSLQSLNFLDTEIDIFYTACIDAGIWKTADVDVLKGLQQNQQSRASELGFGRVTRTDVEYARSI